MLKTSVYPAASLLLSHRCFHWVHCLIFRLVMRLGSRVRASDLSNAGRCDAPIGSLIFGVFRHKCHARYCSVCQHGVRSLQGCRPYFAQRSCEKHLGCRADLLLGSFYAFTPLKGAPAHRAQAFCSIQAHNAALAQNNCSIQTLCTIA